MPNTLEEPKGATVTRRVARKIPCALSVLFCLPGGAVLFEMLQKAWGFSLPFSVGLVFVGACAMLCGLWLRSRFLVTRATSWAICFVGYAALANILAPERRVDLQLKWLFYAGLAGGAVGVVGSPAWSLSPFPSRRPHASQAGRDVQNRPRPRWPQFTLRTLLVSVAAIAIILGFFSRETGRFLRYEKAVAAIWSTGGHVGYSKVEIRQPLFLDWLGDLLGRACRQQITHLSLGPTADDTELLALGADALANLEHLDLRSSRVADAGLVCVQQVENLRTLELGPRTSDAGLVHLKKLPHLTRLDVVGTRVTGSGLAHLRQLRMLECLSLDGSPVRDAGLAHLNGLVGLRRLILRGAEITGDGLVHLQGLPKLRYLDLSNTQVTDAGLAKLRALPELEILCLAGTQVTDAALAHLKGFPRLYSLSVDGTQTTLAGLTELSGVLRLQGLYLQGNPVTDDALVHLRAFPQLTHLDLGGTKVTDAGLVHLKHLPELEYLNLWGTKVTDAGLPHLKSLPEIQHLNLSGPRVTDTGVAEFRRARPNVEVSHLSP